MPPHLCALATLVLACRPVLSRIVGAAVIPHGDFAYDPSLVHNANGSLAVHNAALKAGKYIASLRPDIVFLSTPHGVALGNDFAAYSNSFAGGFAAVGGDLHNKSFIPYKVPLTNVTLDANLTATLISALGGVRANVTALSSFADSEPQALRWGEVIPLTFLPKPTLLSSQLLVLSQPLRRYTRAKEMVPELLRLGEAAFSHLDPLDARVAIVISSDLAHTHLASGPYGYSPYAAKFDAAISRWARDPLHDSNALLVDAAAYEGKALSCGFTGLVMLHGALRAAAAPSKRWAPRLLANEAPTYYGMAVAVF